MTTPIVSVIVATHNRAELLPRAIESLQNQTYQDFEIIIIDDASQDHTPEVIEGLKRSDARIRSIRSDNNIGPGAARNLGIGQAKGEFIAIMDDDDVSYSSRLDIQVQAFNDDQELDLVCSTVNFIDENDNIIGVHPKSIINDDFPDNPDSLFIFLYIFGSCPINNSTIMVRNYIWNHFTYPENLFVGEDYIFFSKLTACGKKIKAIKEPLVRMDRRSNRVGLTANKQIDKMELYKILRDWLAEKGINKYKEFNNIAMSNRFIYQRRFSGSIKGKLLLLLAWLYSPSNPNVKKILLRK